MKILIFIISVALLKLACSAEINNENKKSAEEIPPTSQPLVNLQNIKNNTKDAAQNILNLFKPEEIKAEDHKKHSLLHHHFNKESPHLHHHHQPPPLCICNGEPIPTLPAFTTGIPSFKGPAYLPTPPTSFDSRKIPTFEPISSRVNNEFYSNSIETPIINHYSPLDLTNLYTFDSNDFK